MIREIKFRGKRLNGGEWVKSMTISRGTIKRKMNHIFFEIEPDKWVGVDPKTVGQFTGIRDKKGEEIYEGDIVKFHTKNGDLNIVIKWDCVSMSFIALCKNGIKCKFNWFTDPLSSELEVIGNIHESK